MSTREFFTERFNAERPVFIKVLRALPADQLDYTPHEKNNSAGDIAWFLALEQGYFAEMFESGTIHRENVPRPGTLDEIVAEYEKQSARAVKALEALDEEKWGGHVRMHFNGKFATAAPIRQWAWFLLFDAIHHRGQLSVYLRPMGGKIPSIYGPSADERP